MVAKKFAFDNPDDALMALADRLGVVAAGSAMPAIKTLGRVLAEDVLADRDSPAADVSAMDGYAIRLSDLDATDMIPVAGQCLPGSPPLQMPNQGVLRIFTGAIVPKVCEAVVKREDTEEAENSIRFLDSARSTPRGGHIRIAGENARGGQRVILSGTQLHAAHRATMENFGCSEATVFERVRVSTITTGDEVRRCFDPSTGDRTLEPWQLHDSNFVSLRSLLGTKAWIEFPFKEWDHCADDRDALTERLYQRLSESDAVILTGGVSMGDYDCVPDVVREVGGEVVFHGLPIRPGKPILGAVTGEGKLILGLPGNPVSATVGCRRMAIPLLAKMSGQKNWLRPQPMVRLVNSGNRTLPLHWMRLVRLNNHGIAEEVPSQGSGDLVSLGQSDGFVEIPSSESGEGPWPFYAW